MDASLASFLVNSKTVQYRPTRQAMLGILKGMVLRSDILSFLGPTSSGR